MRRNCLRFARALAALSLFGCSHVDPPSPLISQVDDSWLNGWRGEPEASASGHLNQHAEQASRDISGDWTGAVVYHADYCKPCGRLIRDLKLRAASGWKTGTGSDVHFKLVDLKDRPSNAAPRIELLPTIIYYQLGKEVARVVGYGGTEAELDAILEKHPRAKKRLQKAEGDKPITESDDGLPKAVFLFPPSGPCLNQSILYQSVPSPAVPYQSSMSIGLLGFPLLSHVRQGAYDPTTGRCW